MKIVFFGEDAFSAIVANSLIDNGYEVVMIATPYYHNFLYKRLELLAQKNGIPFSREPDFHTTDFLERVKAHRPDLLVITHFEKLIRKELISLPRLGCLNLHPSLLPAYRGMSPQHWPIINGDKETGITVHYIDEGIDTGNILIQKKVPLHADMYVADLQKSMLPVYGTIMAEAVTQIANNNDKGFKQDIEKGSLYGRLKLKDVTITSDTKTQFAYNLVRAVSKPYMGARFERYILWKAHLPKKGEEAELLLSHADVGLYANSAEKTFLRLHDGVLIIDSYELIPTQ